MAIAAAVVALAGACQPKTIPPLPPPPSVPATTTSTTIDFSALGLPEIPGRTTTTVAMGPGKATLAGVVVGPDGAPVPTAVVHAERLVGDGAATMDVLTGGDGRFEMATVLGGRYRLRAWKQAPDNLALVEPQVFFLEGSEKKDTTLKVTPYTGVAVTAAIAPDPPLIDTPANLVVQAVDRAVDANGIVRSVPIPGVRAELFGTGDWRVQTPVATGTDGAGRARWTLVCQRVGQQPLSVVIGESAAFNLNLPNCTVPPPDPSQEPTDEGAPPTTAEATPAGPTTTAKPAPTTTTTGRPSTTTTTARPTTTTARPTTTTAP